MRLLITLAAGLLCLGGCSKQREVEEAHKQATADVAAAIYEACVAIEAGVPIELPLRAIRLGAISIITTQGRRWPNAEAWLNQQGAGETP